jgi:hypothetical protein
VQRSLENKSNRVLSPTSVKEMLSPVGVGDHAVGFYIAKRGQGWYFGHGGGNWGFRCILEAHKTKGYGVAIIANSENGEVVMNEIKGRIERAYGYDSLNKSVPR